MKTILSDFGRKASAPAGTRAVRRRTRTAVAALALCALAVPAAGLADIPDAYLDYVESTGVQYVDTGVTGKSGTRMVAFMEWLSRPSVQSFLWRRRPERSSLSPYTSAGSHQVGYASLSQYQIQGGGNAASADTRFRVETTLEAGSQSINVRSLDGSGYNGTRTYNDAAAVDLGQSLYLFARNDAGTANQFSVVRVCSLQFWQKDGNGDWRLVRHFLPCRKDNRAALYDKVEGTIHFPQGGDLVAGATLPRPVELVEWVQSDGADGDRQLYIDTGIVGKAGLGMVAEMAWGERPTADSALCGAMSSDGKRVTPYTSAGTHQMGYDTWNAQIQGGGNAANAGIRYRVSSFLTGGSQYLNVKALDGSGYDGTRTYTTAAAVDTAQTLYLFARNDAATPNQFAAVRLYSLVLTNELGVARDFRPCVADDGRAGLYDTVDERVFFPVAAVGGATAEFRLATEVGAVTNLAATTKWPLTRPEWIEANGTNDYVDLGVVARDGIRMEAEVEWNALPGAATFCGAATNGTAGLFTTYRITTGDGSNFHRIGYYNGSSTMSGGNAKPAVGVRYKVETSLTNGEQVFKVAKQENGDWVPVGNGKRTANLSFPAGFADLGLPLYLFARNLNGVPDEFAPARLYTFKLWQDGSLVRDLVPAFDPRDGAPSLWDKRSETFFRNAGGYRLAAGGETTPFPPRAMLFLLR